MRTMFPQALGQAGIVAIRQPALLCDHTIPKWTLAGFAG
jgi:hypothetical protein